PRWMGGCIASPARSPPDPALVLRVLPEVVQRAPDDLGIGDLVLGIEDLLDPIVERLVQRRARERGDGRCVVRVHPLHRPTAFDLLEPDERVVGGRRRGWLLRGKRHRGEACKQGKKSDSGSVWAIHAGSWWRRWRQS